MANQVISVNRKKYAVGLFWQPVATGFFARNYARSLARGVDKKLNLFTEYRSMVGLGARKFGHRTAMPSAAASIVDSFPEFSSFLAVFQVDKGYYLVAMRNGVILEDKLFATESEARAEYSKLSQIPDWGTFVAPGTWGMPRAVERTISEVVSGGARAVLRSISRVRAALGPLVIIVLFLALIGSIFREPLHQMMMPRPQISQINPELAAEYKRQIEEKNRELDAEFNIEKEPEPEPIVPPYDSLPDVAARADMCFRAMAFVMQNVTGWNQTSVECTELNAVAEFQRDFGTLDDFYVMATELMPGAIVTKQNEDMLRVSVPLPAVQSVASQDERDAETLLRDVQSAFQSIGTPIESQIVVDVLSNGVDTMSLNIVEIAVESKLVPSQFMRIFDEFGGVYMTRCAWDASRRIWNYEVIIYAK